MTSADYVTSGIDTSAVVPPHRRVAWRDHVVNNHGHLGIDYRAGDPSFTGGTRVQRCGDIQLVEFWSDPIAYERPRGAADRDADDSLRVLVPLAGNLRVMSGSAAQRLSPGTAAAVSMERGFRIEQDRATRAFVLTLPRSMWPSDITGAPVTWGLAEGNGAIFSAMLRQLALERSRLDGDGFVRACEAAALVIPQRGGDPVAGARAIARQYADSPDFGPGELASSLGWSLRSVQQALHAEGTSPAALIREIRIDRAAARLRDPVWSARSVSEIAYASGFGSLSAFNSAFRARFDCSPSATRT